MAYVQVRKQRITPLIEAVQKQDVDAVRSRIEAGDDVEATDSYGQTALHWATKDKSVEIVQLLLDAGADPNAKDEDGDTPLQNAEKNPNPAIAEALAQLEGRLATESEKKHEPLRTAMVAKETPLATSGRLKTHTNTGERNSATSAMTIKERFTLKGHTDQIWDCAISPDSSFIVSASSDNTLKVWDTATGRPRATFTGHTERVTTCAISPDSSFIVSGSSDNSLKIWDLRTGKERAIRPSHFMAVNKCAISPDSSFIVSASEDKNLSVWNAAPPLRQRPLFGHTERVNSCAISPDSSFIVSASWDKTLKVWDAVTGNKRKATLTGHTARVSTCAISPDSSFIVSTCWDGTLKVWDAATCQELATLAGHTGLVMNCAISPDSSYIVSASWDNTLKVWDAATCQELATLAGHTERVNSCAISPDSSFIVSASADNTLKVWDAATGEERVTLAGHTEGVQGCAISPDSSFIVSWSSDHTLKIWDVASEIRESREAKPVHLVEAVDQTPAGERPEVTVSDVTSMREQGDVESLVQVLQSDSDPMLRHLAARSLGDLGGPRARDALQNCLSSDEPMVAAAASTALGQLEANIVTGKRVVKAIETEKARLEAEIAAETAESKQAGSAGKIWQGVYWVGILTLITSCLLVGLPLLDGNSVVEPSYMVCTGVTIGVAILLIFVSSRRIPSKQSPEGTTSGSEKEFQKLIKALGNKDASVRKSAAEGLGELGDARAVRWLLLRLKDEDNLVGVRAAEALGKIGTPALPPLLDALKAQDSWVWVRAVRALGGIGTPAVGPLLIVLLDDDSSGRKRSGAANALGEIGDARAVEPLLIALKDDDMSVRLRAAEALGKIGDARAVEPLLIALKDDSEGVREKAARALKNLGVQPDEAKSLEAESLEQRPEERTPGSGGVCDICNAPGMGTMINAEQMREAVFKRGFDPFQSGPLKDYASLSGLGVKEAYEDWKNVVAQDTTGWNICPNCMSMLKPYL